MHNKTILRRKQNLTKLLDISFEKLVYQMRQIGFNKDPFIKNMFFGFIKSYAYTDIIHFLTISYMMTKDDKYLGGEFQDIIESIRKLFERMYNEYKENEYKEKGLTISVFNTYRYCFFKFIEIYNYSILSDSIIKDTILYHNTKNYLKQINL